MPREAAGTTVTWDTHWLNNEYHPKNHGRLIRYRTLYRPKYIIGYKTVTELAWRCCPGFTGEGCHEVPTQQPGLLTHFPSPRIPPISNMFPGPRPPPSHPKLHPEPFPGPPSSPKKSDYGRKLPGVIGDRLDHLEEEVRRLSQSYNSLHTMVNGLGDHLRHAIQEDTNKMIGTLMNAPRVPDSSVGFGVIPGGVPDAPEKADVTFPRVGDIMGKVTEVSDMLKTKTDLLNEVHGMVLDHDGRIKHLLDAAKPSPLTSIDILEEFIERKLTSVRAEILDGFEKKLLNIQSTCDFRIKEVQEQCEKEKATNLQLQQTLDGKELQIKKEISHLESQIHGLTVVESCCSNINYLTERLDSLEKNMHIITESQKNQQSRLESELPQISSVTFENFFNGRFEDIEAKINASERDMDGRCHEIEGGIRALVDLEVDGIKTSVEDKIRTLEERFMTIVGELGNISMPVSLDGAAMPLLEREIVTIKKQTSEGIEVLQNRLTVLESLCTQCSSSSVVEHFKTDIEGCQNRSQDLLLKHDVNSELLKKLNSTVLEIQRRIELEEANSLQGEITLLKINLNTVSKSLTGLKDSVSQYSDTVVHINSSFDERERKLSGEVHSIQEKVQDQGSQLSFSNRNVLDLKGDLERLKLRILNDFGNCKYLAQDLQKEVFQFDGRMAQVENMCGKLGVVTGSLDLIKDALEKHTGDLWGYMDHMNGTLEVHAQEITTLKDNLLDCQAKVREISEQFGVLPESLQHKNR
uniref:EMILIN-3 isoform X2 n=1 Tax=Geotrypetes seraphini TaxID=260995 RepID=A0A6P8SW72_GEOSA|nr:EMILIN-3 isoform X2 [Geotrypetes seraphini]